MHPSALHYGKAFFETYFADCSANSLTFLDVGAQDFNGSLRQFAPAGSRYIGVDFDAGRGVDVVLHDPYSLPFESASIDGVVCSSVFEHSEFFWLLILETLRVLKPTGLLYINVPSNGAIHRFPIDAWRFYPDAGKALVNWARRNGVEATLLESFIGAKSGDPLREGMWNDFVAVIAKDEAHVSVPRRRIVDLEPAPLSAYRIDQVSQAEGFVLTPDQIEISNAFKRISTEVHSSTQLRTELQVKSAELEEARAKLAYLEERIESLSVQQKELQVEIELARADLSTMSEQLASARKYIVDLLTSSSWRVTAPLRWIGGLLRGMRFMHSETAHPERESQPDQEPNLQVANEVLIKTGKPTSASFEVLSGLKPAHPPTQYTVDKSTVIAFYLPQYHRITENSEWWGPGFTEWTNVVKGSPNYEGHYQPHLPRELGFYDLSNIEVMREQAEIAKRYGVTAFCFYYYWFSGRRILEKPIDNFLASDIDLQYCLCWANENWTRTWDGQEKSVLLHQKYLDTDPPAFINSLLPHFRDTRYIRIQDKPLLVVYRAKDIPDVSTVFDIWRGIVRNAGFAGLHIAVVDFYDIKHPNEVGADALVEFPPHKFNGPQSIPDTVPPITNPNFTGGIVDYSKVLIQSANRPAPEFLLYRGALPSWDNTPRRQNTPTILHGAHPDLFAAWLRYLRAYTRETFADESHRILFINAWNEWGEGCHLEPDQMWGLRNLEAVNSSSWYAPTSNTRESERQHLISAALEAIERRSNVAPRSLNEPTTRPNLNARKVTDSTFAIWSAQRLKHYPMLYGAGRLVYRLLRFLRGR